MLYDDDCYYCGMPATSIDHVVPQSLLQAAMVAGDTNSWLELQSRGRKLVVSACQQCNSILGKGYDRTLEERKQRLKRLLRKKLQRDLDMPDWTDAEIEQLSPRLQKTIREGLIRRWLAQQRLRW